MSVCQHGSDGDDKCDQTQHDEHYVGGLDAMRAVRARRGRFERTAGEWKPPVTPCKGSATEIHHRRVEIREQSVSSALKFSYCT